MKDNRPTLSVVIIEHNSVDTISKPIESVLSQQGVNCSEDVELVVVDDASDEGKSPKELCDKQYAGKFKNLNFCVLTENNHKLGALRKKGTDEATGHWITYLDSDDELLPNTLAQVFELIGKMREVEPESIGMWTHEIVITENGTEHDDFHIGHLHGKFFSIDFMKEYGLNFDPDMVFEEDLYFNELFFMTSTVMGRFIGQCGLQTYKYKQSSTSTCHRTVTRCKETGVLEPDHVLVHFDDYIKGSMALALRFYKSSPTPKITDTMMSCICSAYALYQYYLFVREQFDTVTFEFTQALYNAWCLISKTFKEFPAELNEETIMKYVYADPDKLLDADMLLYNAYGPGKYIPRAICTQSLREFIRAAFEY